ncbi:MAG TPA: hypothetical protein VMX13_04010 [Sedimentisphaerales bacterium]|nr:hypothetical protein [Sedimentisphaerales bacterium]
MSKSKEELIESICQINSNATPEVLNNFTDEDLREYLESLLATEKIPSHC